MGCTPVLGRYRHNLDITDAFVTINEQFHGASSAYQGIKAIYKIDNRCKFVRYRNGDLTKAIVTEKYDDGAEICLMSPLPRSKLFKPTVPNLWIVPRRLAVTCQTKRGR